eukprot:2435679-Prorocentrum_lima.AAC.1
MLDSLVRVSRRVVEKHFVRVARADDRTRGLKQHLDLLPPPQASRTGQQCFSSFPHGTCSLLVSHPYLALDGIYHPLELQSQTTRLFEETCWTRILTTNGAITLLGVPSQTTSMGSESSTFPSADYIPEGFSLSFSRFTRRY